MEERSATRYRSIFWPIVLIGIGVIWLLANLEIIPGINWRILWRFWPLLLIALGLDLIFARRSTIWGAIVGLGTIGLIIALLLIGPTIEFPGGMDAITERFSEPLGTSESAFVSVELSVGPSHIYPLKDSPNLIDAEITHIGEIDFDVQGETQKKVSIRQIGGVHIDWFDWMDEKDLRWEIGLSPDIPLELEIEGGLGDADFDLRGLSLAGLEVEVDVGDIELTLPAAESSYDVKVIGDVGDINITIEEGAHGNWEIEGDVGDVVIVIPEDAAVRLDAETDVGNIHVPAQFQKISSSEQEFVGESGIWQTSGFSASDRQIVINFNGAVGDLTIR
jgi:hypothetical protein